MKRTTPSSLALTLFLIAGTGCPPGGGATRRGAVTTGVTIL